MPYKCKIKAAARAKAYYESNRETLIEYHKAYRLENKEAIAVKDKARKEANKEKNAARAKAYAEANPEVLTARAKAYYESNRETILAKSKAYRAANKEAIVARKKAYYEANKEAVLARNKEYVKENPEKKAASRAKRRAAKLQRTPDWLTDVQLAEIQSFYIESEIRTRLTGIQHHVDHILPLQGKNVSGLHVPWNLQVITATENVRKSNKYAA